MAINYGKGKNDSDYDLAARVHLICSLTAWGCQGAHNGPCDSLGWQGGHFAFSASFLILNEIMPPGMACCKTICERPKIFSPASGMRGSPCRTVCPPR